MFPETPRVIYRKKPSEVFCQLRFPAILRIDAEVPAAFQESIRAYYPNYQEKSKFGVPMLEFPIAAKLYEFNSSDNLWSVLLDRDTLTVTTRAYERWEHFKDRFDLPFQALCDKYHPVHFSRIGLRYRDMICRNKLDLIGVAWSELLNPQIACEFASPEICDHIEQLVHQVVIRDGKKQIFLQHGLAPPVFQQHGLAQPDPESYVIDSDFSVEDETRTDDVQTLLEGFNGEARRLFRWCITERLHKALEPESA